MWTRLSQDSQLMQRISEDISKKGHSAAESPFSVPYGQIQKQYPVFGYVY